MTWPFQVAFTLDVLLLALVISAILKMKGRPPAAATWSFGVPLFLLSLCGGFGVLFVAILAPWWIGLSLRGNRTRLGSAIALPSLALLLAGTGLVGYSRPAQFPPSPGRSATLQVSLEGLASSLGSPGATHWPLSGGIAGAAVFLCLLLLLRGFRRHRDSRLACGGMIGALGGILGLALALGDSRAGLSPFFGFAGRYVTLFCLFPFLLFAAADLGGRPLLARIVQIILFAGSVLVYFPNARQAENDLAPRRRAIESLLPDIRAGLPIPALAARHSSYWCPGNPTMFEQGLLELARSRMAIYRTWTPPTR
jgi:hypothetical protein